MIFSNGGMEYAHLINGLLRNIINLKRKLTYEEKIKH